MHDLHRTFLNVEVTLLEDTKLVRGHQSSWLIPAQFDDPNSVWGHWIDVKPPIHLDANLV